jgi:AcrR family transcriptional regulator
MREDARTMAHATDGTARATAESATDRISAILDAACRVIARDGAHGLHMRAVADEAGVSKALVHYYFATRQELLRRAFGHAEHALDAMVEAELAGLDTGRLRLERVLLLGLEASTAAPDGRGLWNEVWSSATFDPALRPLMRDWYSTWLGRLHALVEEGLRDGSIRPLDDPASVAWRLGALADGVESLLYLEVVDPDGAAGMVLDAVARELSPPGA